MNKQPVTIAPTKYEIMVRNKREAKALQRLADIKSMIALDPNDPNWWINVQKYSHLGVPLTSLSPELSQRWFDQLMQRIRNRRQEKYS